VALKTMKRGEKANLVIQPSCGLEPPGGEGLGLGEDKGGRRLPGLKGGSVQAACEACLVPDGGAQPTPAPTSLADAYGDEGLQGVPPGAVLDVDVKLDAIREVVLVAPGVTKKTLADSTEWRTANEGAKVKLRCARGRGRRGRREGRAYCRWQAVLNSLVRASTSVTHARNTHTAPTRTHVIARAALARPLPPKKTQVQGHAARRHRV
jgi:hypothetical protein